jgi:TRAP-type C4-dicarboxylate transport system permease small subunit
MARVEAAWGRILQAFAALNGLIVLSLALMITTDVLVRWLSGRPLVGVFEISRVLFVPVIFLTLALVQWTDRQVRVDALVANATGRLRVGVRGIDQILALTFFLVLLWTGWESWIEAFRGGFVGMGMLGIPHAWPMGFLVFGTLLTVITLVLLLLRSIRQLIRGVAADEKLEPYAPPLSED